MLKTRWRYLSICLPKINGEEKVRKLRLICISILLLIVVFVMSSCQTAVDCNGGELLDDERLSEIKADIFSEKSTVNIDQTEKQTNDDTISENISEEKESLTEEGSEADEDVTQGDIIVYWSENGKVWHTDRNCRYIKNSDVVSGYSSDAIEKGKKSECKSCGSSTSDNDEYTEVEEETTQSDEEIVFEDVVYWTKKGSVWHYDRECRYIKNSEVELGEVDDAIASGKDRACSSCGK